ncbi:MAG: arginine--tRNA ligase [Clostridia bacterium]
MIDCKKIISELLVNEIDNLDYQQIYDLIEVPPRAEMGDFALPCFKFAKIMRKSPNQIAKNFEDLGINHSIFSQIVAQGPYLNFFLDYKEFAKSLLSEIFDKNKEYGSEEEKNKNIVIDYSSPNIAKPFHIGHLRSTVIGQSLYNIYSHLGYSCIGINHLGDWGTQFGKQILAYKMWGDEKVVEKDPINELVKLYVKFHEEADKNPQLEDKAREWFKRLENGDQEALKIWKSISKASMEEFNKLYSILGIDFDFNTGESFYRDKVDPVINELEEKNLIKESQGALIVDLGEEMPPCLIKKADGTTIYTSRDIAAAFYRKNTFDFHKALYVTDYSQSLHFKQWIKVIELMGYDWADNIFHVPFGRVRLTEGKMQTRKGNVILLKEVLSEAIDKTRNIIQERNPELPNREIIAKDVAVGALIFNDLYNNRINDIVFDWDELLNFEGETGPYIQYTFARSCRVLEKSVDAITPNIDYSLLTDQESIDLLKVLYDFPNAIKEAAHQLEPSLVSRQVMKIARAFNRFYHNNQIIVDQENIRLARLLLCYSANVALEIGLNLLNMPTPNRM